MELLYPAAEVDDRHYLRSALALGDRHEVRTRCPIYAGNRIKLVDEGVRVDSRLYDKLANHRLIPKIDECLATRDQLTPGQVLEIALELLGREPGLAPLRQDSLFPGTLKQVFQSLSLSATMAFRLTVARHQRPEVFEHSLRVTMLALFLASGLRQGIGNLVILATAGLFHDIGLLHVPAQLLSPGQRLNRESRKYLYTHPVTGYLVVQGDRSFPPKIARIILEHHERLDGSGYPRGLKAVELAPESQILMLAELANAFLERNPGLQDLTRFSVVLKLNHAKFSREYSNRLLHLMQRLATGTQEAREETATYHHDLDRLCQELDELITDFLLIDRHGLTGSLSAEGVACPHGRLLAERMAGLLRNLNDAGLVLNRKDDILQAVLEDEQAAIELHILIAEARWQVNDIFHEIQRRLPDGGACLDGWPPGWINWFRKQDLRCEVV